MFASLRFINFVRTNWREEEGIPFRVRIIFPRAHPASPPFIFNLLSTLVGREEAEFAIYFASLCSGRLIVFLRHLFLFGGAFSWESRDEATGSVVCSPLYLSSSRSAFAASLSVTYEQTRRTTLQ